MHQDIECPLEASFIYLHLPRREPMSYEYLSGLSNATHAAHVYCASKAEGLLAVR
jgi:hypothetical protein